MDFMFFLDAVKMPNQLLDIHKNVQIIPLCIVVKKFYDTITDFNTLRRNISANPAQNMLSIILFNVLCHLTSRGK